MPPRRLRSPSIISSPNSSIVSIPLDYELEVIGASFDGDGDGEVTGIGDPAISHHPMMGERKTDWRSIYLSSVLSFISQVQFSLYFSSLWPFLKEVGVITTPPPLTTTPLSAGPISF